MPAPLLFFFAWIAAAPGLALLIDTTLGGGSVLMGWAHNLGMLLFFITLLGIWQNRTQLDRAALAMIGAGVTIIAASAASWGTQISPWPFSAYVAFSLAIGLWLAALARGAHTPTRAWTGAGVAMAIGLAPVLGLVAWVGMVMGAHDVYMLVHGIPGFGNIRAIGHFAGWAMVGAAAAAFVLPRTRHAAGALLLLIIASFVLGWSGGRTGFVAALVGIVFAAVVARAKWKRLIGVGAAIVVGLGLSIFSPQPNNQFGVLDRMARVVEGIAKDAMDVAVEGATTGATATAAATNSASSRRLELWAKGWETILERPLLGHGLATWRHDGDISQYRSVFHLHNLPLDTLHSYGIPIGAALLLVLLLGFVKTQVSAWKVGPDAAVPAGWLAATSAMCLFDAVGWMPFGAAMIGATMGWLLIATRLYPKNGRGDAEPDQSAARDDTPHTEQ